ncbi:hypothetical protein NLR84_26250, partial [Escherichia coli]|nr:hypothetical protein [Escherichia coli]
VQLGEDGIATAVPGIVDAVTGQGQRGHHDSGKVRALELRRTRHSVEADTVPGASIGQNR